MYDVPAMVLQVWYKKRKRPRFHPNRIQRLWGTIGLIVFPLFIISLNFEDSAGHCWIMFIPLLNAFTHKARGRLRERLRRLLAYRRVCMKNVDRGCWYNFALSLWLPVVKPVLVLDECSKCVEHILVELVLAGQNKLKCGVQELVSLGHRNISTVASWSEYTKVDHAIERCVESYSKAYSIRGHFLNPNRHW